MLNTTFRLGSVVWARGAGGAPSGTVGRGRRHAALCRHAGKGHVARA